MLDRRVYERIAAGEVVFLRKVVDGPTDKSYGIQVAALAGLPKEVVSRAKDILASIESRDAITVSPQPGGARARSVQTVLFEPDGTPYSGGRPRPSPIEEEIRGIDLMNITPLQALAKLERLKERLGAEGACDGTSDGDDGKGDGGGEPAAASGPKGGAKGTGGG